VPVIVLGLGTLGLGVIFFFVGPGIPTVALWRRGRELNPWSGGSIKPAWSVAKPQVGSTYFKPVERATAGRRYVKYNCHGIYSYAASCCRPLRGLAVLSIIFLGSATLHPGPGSRPSISAEVQDFTLHLSQV